MFIFRSSCTYAPLALSITQPQLAVQNGHLHGLAAMTEAQGTKVAWDALAMCAAGA